MVAIVFVWLSLILYVRHLQWY